MKREVITTGKTIDEAISSAAAELGVAIGEFEYTVIDEPKKGLFGIGAVPAKIQATYTEKGEDLALRFVKTLISDMGLNVNVELRAGDGDAKLIDITGEGAGILIGHHGDTLDSIQYPDPSGRTGTDVDESAAGTDHQARLQFACR